MDFKDYQKASLKHLTTCKAMLDSVDLLASNTSALINLGNAKLAVLHNAYYLSGYTLESIINYSIFKHYKWKEASVHTTDHNFSARCDVSFYPKTQRLKGTGNYNFWLSQHDFKRNIQILKRTFPNSGIPLLDHTVKVEGDLLDLYRSWETEIRYHPYTNPYPKIQLSEDSVKRFINLTEEVYNNLMKLVG